MAEHMDTKTGTVQKQTLPNGLTIITEEMPMVRTVAVGIWVRGGSRIEPGPRNGMSHFIEHMVFKGTERRSAEEIAREGDALGGHLDAFTAKELVCFNAKVLDEHLPRAVDLLADLVRGPLFRETDIQKERNVVLEEIKMDEDNPDSLVHELFTQTFWRDHALGRPILGTPETLAGFDSKVVREFFQRCYVPNQMLVTAAGRLDHARFVELVAEEFGTLRPPQDGYRDARPTPQARLTTRSKGELQQMHLCVGVPCYPLTHERRYALLVLNTILGGGMSSRLFQNIREREGLAYTIFSDLHTYRDTGCLVVYAGTAREATRKTLHLILREFARLKKEPVPAADLRRAQDNLKATLMFSLESTGARMSHLARQEIYFGRFISLDEILAAINAVTVEQLQEIAREFFQPELVGAAVLGPLDGFQIARDELTC
ncbi:MAG: M16 family metallopeptidase [Terriglobia bacterium]